jgi:hypothetical protein
MGNIQAASLSHLSKLSRTRSCNRKYPHILGLCAYIITRFYKTNKLLRRNVTFPLAFMIFRLPISQILHLENVHAEAKKWKRVLGEGIPSLNIAVHNVLLHSIRGHPTPVSHSPRSIFLANVKITINRGRNGAD